MTSSVEVTVTQRDGGTGLDRRGLEKGRSFGKGAEFDRCVVRFAHDALSRKKRNARCEGCVTIAGGWCNKSVANPCLNF